MTDLTGTNAIGTEGPLTPPPGVTVKTEDEQSLYRASLEFERFFLQNMMKSMNAATDALKGGEENGPGTAGLGTFKDMANDQMVQSMLDGGGLGMASVLYQQMVENLPAISKSAANGGIATEGDAP